MKMWWHHPLLFAINICVYVDVGERQILTGGWRGGSTLFVCHPGCEVVKAAKFDQKMLPLY